VIDNYENMRVVVVAIMYIVHQSLWFVVCNCVSILVGCKWFVCDCAVNHLKQITHCSVEAAEY